VCVCRGPPFLAPLNKAHKQARPVPKYHSEEFPTKPPSLVWGIAASEYLTWICIGDRHKLPSLGELMAEQPKNPGAPRSWNGQEVMTRGISHPASLAEQGNDSKTRGAAERCRGQKIKQNLSPLFWESVFWGGPSRRQTTPRPVQHGVGSNWSRTPLDPNRCQCLKGRNPAAERKEAAAAERARRARNRLTLRVLLDDWNRLHLVARRPSYAAEAVRAPAMRCAVHVMQRT
jgi:hypothetical protein